MHTDDQLLCAHDCQATRVQLYGLSQGTLLDFIVTPTAAYRVFMDEKGELDECYNVQVRDVFCDFYAACR